MLRENTYSDYLKVNEYYKLYRKNPSQKLFFLYVQPLINPFLMLYDGNIQQTKPVLMFLNYFKKCSFKSINIEGFKRFKNATSQFTREDFKQELMVALFLCLKRYDEKKGFLIPFLYKSFHNSLLEALKPKIKNSGINNIICESPSTIDIYNQYLQELIDFDTLLYKHCTPPITSTNANIYFNDKWILCPDKDGPFSFLSPSDRNLLVNYYIRKHTDSEIAESYGVCRATINRIRQQIKSSLEVI